MNLLSRNQEIIKRLITRVGTSVAQISTMDSDIELTRNFDAHQYIRTYFSKDIVMFHVMANQRLKNTIQTILLHCKGILSKLSSDSATLIQMKQLCVLYAIIECCLRQTSSNTSGEIVDEVISQELHGQACQILEKDFGSYTCYITTACKSLLGTFGAACTDIYTFFASSLHQDLSSKVAQKQLPINLKVLSCLPNSINSVPEFLNPLVTPISDVPKKFRIQYCDMITNGLILAFDRNPTAFSHFIKAGMDVNVAKEISTKIEEWNEGQKNIAWPTQVTLLALQPGFLYSTDDPQKIPVYSKLLEALNSQGQQRIPATSAALYFFKEFVLSGCSFLLSRYAKDLVKPALKSVFGGQPVIQSPQLTKISTKDFIIAVANLDTQNFTSKLLPMITKNSLVSAKLIRRACKLYQYFSDVFDPIIVILAKLTCTIFESLEDVTIYKIMLKAYTYCPLLLHYTVRTEPTILKKFFEIIKKHEEVSPQDALYGFWKEEFTSLYQTNNAFIAIVKAFLNFTLERYKNTTLYKSTLFGKAIPGLVILIIDFTVTIFSDPHQEDIHVKFTHLFEALALLFLASSNKETRLSGVHIMESFLQIIHSGEEFKQLNYPGDFYQCIVRDAKMTPNLTTAHTSIKGSLRLIPEKSSGIEVANMVLIPYFFALTKTLAPNIALVSKKEYPTLDFPRDFLIDEWISTVSFIYAVPFEQALTLFDQMKILLTDADDLGALTTTAIPPSLSQFYMSYIVELLVSWVNQHQTQQGFFEPSDELNVFIEHIVITTIGLFKQKSVWLYGVIDLNVVGELMFKLVSYCSLVPGENLRLHCAQMIITIIDLLKSIGVMIQPATRHQIARSLLPWIPTISRVSRQYLATIQKALAIILDDLNLRDCISSDEVEDVDKQIEANFMFFFAAIRTRLDSDETVGSTMIPILAALLKQNLGVAIGHCVSMGFENSSIVRSAFINAVASVFRIPETKVIDSVEAEIEVSLIDLLFANEFELLIFVSPLVPLSKAEVFGAEIIKAGIYKGCIYELMEKLVTIEVQEYDDTNKNSLFRGNAIVPKAIGSYPKIVATQWMINLIQSIYSEVLEGCNQGKDYQIDPSRLSEGASISQNRKAFTRVLKMSATKIIESRAVMPSGLIKACKMIYNAVYKKFGDFANQMLGSFLFLRFLFPAFAVLQNVGIYDAPENAAGVMKQISIVLMALMNNRGNASLKLEYLSPFSDLTMETYERFSNFFDDIVNAEVTNDELPQINEKDVITNLHREFYAIISKLENSIEPLPEDSTLIPQVNGLVQKLRSMGTPISDSKRGKIGVSQEGEIDEIFSMNFPDAELSNVSTLVVSGEYESPDGSQLLIVDFSMIKEVRNPLIIPHVMMKAISILNRSPYILLLTTGFDEKHIPDPEFFIQHLSYLQTLVKKWIVPYPSVAFVTFMSQNPEIFSNMDRFVFPTELQQFIDVVGPIKNIPMHTQEFFAPPTSFHRAVVYSTAVQIAVKENSIAVSYDGIKVNGLTIVPTDVILYEDIIQFTRSIASKDNPDTFKFFITIANENLPVTTSTNSTLFDTIQQQSSQYWTLHQNVQGVSVDNSTFQWLMINLAFSNMISKDVSRDVHRGAIALLYAVYNSFNFKRTIAPTKLQTASMPDNLLGYVNRLSEDLAQNNPDSASDFLGEFFKLYEYVNEESRPFLIQYASYWFEQWAKNPTSIYSSIIKVYEQTKNPIPFQLFIWPKIANYKEAVDCLLFSYITSNSAQAPEVITSLALYACDFVSKQIIGILEGQKPSEIILKTVISLLSHSALNFELIGSRLIYQLVQLRIICRPSLIPLLLDLTANAFSCLLDGSLEIDYRKALKCFEDVNGRQEFEGGGDCRPWLSNIFSFASILKSYPRKKELYLLFSNDLEHNDLIKSTSGMIFAAASYEGDPTDYADELINKLRQNISVQTRNAILVALALLDMNSVLAARLYFVGLIFNFLEQKTTAYLLIAESAAVLARESDGGNHIHLLAKKSNVKSFLRRTCLNLKKHWIRAAIVALASTIDQTNETYIHKIAQICPDDEFSKAILTKSVKTLHFHASKFNKDEVTLATVLILLIGASKKNEFMWKNLKVLCSQFPHTTEDLAIPDELKNSALENAAEPEFALLLFKFRKEPNQSIEVPQMLKQILAGKHQFIITAEEARHFLSSKKHEKSQSEENLTSRSQS